MKFVWFWTFWHWSREAFRAGALLRGPLPGIAAHWDEWFRHEASKGDLAAIEDVGRSEGGQREFVAWLRRHWAREAVPGKNPLAIRFVLGQLSQVPPFDEWAALERHRAGYGAGGIHAIVLSEGSPGEPQDVRRVEAVVLPVEPRAALPSVVPEGFLAGEAELDAPRRAAMSLLDGKGLARFLVSWIASGRRPYPRPVGIALALSWLAVGGLILYLLAGPDPGGALVPLSLALVAAWAGLVAMSLGTAGTQSFRAWRHGREIRARFERSQARLHMEAGLTLRGGSAGLPFCLSLLAAALRAYRRGAPRSWLWGRFSGEMLRHGLAWAATGTVTPEGRIRPVVLEPKLRACIQDGGIEHILTPRQRGAGRRAVRDLSASLEPGVRREAPAASPAPGLRLGFAAEKRRLLSHPSSHAALSLMAIAKLRSAWQIASNACAGLVTLVLLAALPDLRSLLLPPPVPAVVAPASPSPYHLWVSLDTEHPDRFLVVFESGFWSNRRAEVAWHEGTHPSARAEIRLHRPARQTTGDEEDGTVWIERRRRFLSREFAPCERVGCYSLSYVSRLGHE